MGVKALATLLFIEIYQEKKNLLDILMGGNSCVKRDITQYSCVEICT